VFTGLPNRTLLSDRIELAMARARSHRGLLAVGLLDLDGFKEINDRLGYDAGDALLIAVARRLRNALRDCDTLARLGGDEMVLLLPDLGGAAEAATTFARIHGCFGQPFELRDGRPVRISASIGYTLFPHDAGPGDVLIRHADQAMYVAKREGKDRVRRARPEDRNDDPRVSDE
jgi:diguanylate cyclase (GGDEF)-like protein